MSMSRPLTPRPFVIDTTLREGTQTPGVRLGVAQSVEIALAIRDLGIDMIECGHPRVGEAERRRVSAVVEACDGVPVLAHARARREDIDAVAETGAQWVGIFVGVNAISAGARLRAPQPVHDLIREAVAHARALGLAVRFTVEDASRTSWAELIAAFKVARTAGAERLCFADTVGTLLPWEVNERIRRLRQELDEVDLEVHFHDDRGLADANSLCAVRAGATWVSSSVNGVGERCGITDTVLLLTNLAAEGWRMPADGIAMQRASALVSAHTRATVDARRPVVGRHAFTHTAKLHREAVERDISTYSWIEPYQLGRDTKFGAHCLPSQLEKLINKPDIVSATELRHHRHGPGDRYVMVDDRVVEDARQYCIIRRIPELDDYGLGHVDSHRHCVDSLFLVAGDGPHLEGLTIEVELEGEAFTVVSPASVFIPSGIRHSYRVISGSGLFVNHVLSGSYEDSLLDESEPSQPTAPPALRGKADTFLVDFLANRCPGIKTTPSTPVTDIFDSLLLLDLFVELEQHCANSISLDDLTAGRTIGEIEALCTDRIRRQERCVASQE